MSIVGLDHVQLAAPPGCEPAARRFFGELLGLREIEKPEPLRGRGGVWFELGDQQLHVGVEHHFAPARKAHPALVVDGPVGLAEVAARLRALGFEVDESQRDSFPGHVRLHAFDGHGNRVEVLQPA